VRGKVIRLHRRQADAVRTHDSELHVASLDADVDMHNHGEHFAGLHGLLDGAMATWCIGERDPVKVREADPAAHTGLGYY
jgi:hypothetical protein